MLSAPFYRPAKRARRTNFPFLFVIAEKDELTPPDAARRAARKIGAEVVSLDCGHFDVYVDYFDEVCEAQLDFLLSNLPTG